MATACTARCSLTNSNARGVWDYDFPAAPSLVDIEVDGRPIKALAQVSKQGFLYVFDRVTGEPVWPIEERPVPTDTDIDTPRPTGGCAPQPDNVLRYDCPRLKLESSFSYRVIANRLCNVDVITVIERFGGSLSSGVSCGLGKFYGISEGEADFLRYGERGDIQEEPEPVELPEG